MDLPARRSGTALTWLALAAVLACGVFVALRLRVVTEITHFALDADDADAGAWIAQLGQGEPARTMIVTVDAATPERARAVAVELASRLQHQPEVAWVRTGPEPGLGERLFAVLHPRRFRFVDRDPATGVPARFDDAGLVRMAQRLRTELSRPSAPAIKRLAVSDPWLIVRDRLAELEAMQGGLALAQGQFVTDDGAAVVLLATRHGPFEGGWQAPLDDAIAGIEAELEADGDVTIERSAIHRFAVVAERSIRAEVQWLSIASSVGVLACLWWGLGRLRFVVLAFVPMAAGVVVAMAAILVATDEIHALTLAFGTTLVGVCVDYPVHLFVHVPLRGEHDREVPGLWPGLLLGAGTTAVGFLALGLTGLPGLREIGLFAAVGVTVALVITRTVVAPWLRRTGPRPPRWLVRAVDRGVPRRRGATVVAAAALALVATGGVGIAGAVWVDDVRVLAPNPEALAAEDARVRARVDRTELGRMLVARGADLEAAAAVQLGLWRALRDEGLLAAPRWSAPILWPAALQRDNLQAVRAQPQLGRRMGAALAAAGLVPAAFEDPERAIAADPGPLDAAALHDAGLSSLIDPFVLQGRDGAALVAFMPAQVDDATLDRVAAAVPGAMVFDQRRFVAALYRRHREGTLGAFAVGLAGIAAILWLRHRSLRACARVLAPAVAGAVAALGLATWPGGELHLLHLVGCLLVLSMGVDYGVFAAEAGRARAGQAETALGVVVAAATTALSFGLLATSQAPALAALGRTVAVGVAVAAALALSSGALQRGRA